MDQALHLIGSFRPLLLALCFSFCQLTIHNRALRLSRDLCVTSFKLLMKKNLTPQCHLFSQSSQYPYGERMFEESKSTNRIVHVGYPGRTPSVNLRFRSFSIKPVESTRSSSIGFSFQLFFCESVATEMTQWRDHK